MKKSSLSLFVGAITLLLLSGCIKMEVSQTINPDKTSHVEVIYDASALASMTEGLTEEVTTDETTTETEGLEITSSTSGFDEACEEFLASTTWTNPTCTATDYVFTMAGDFSLENDPALTISNGATGTNYRYDIQNLYTQLNAVGESQDQDFSDAALQEQKAYAEEFGISLTYTLTMPGKITNADVGTISDDGKSVSINLFDMAGMESAYVESTVKGTPWLYIGGGVLLLVVVVGGVMMMKGKKKSTV